MVNYEDYVKECLKKAETIAKDMGYSDNASIIAIFNKICSHFHYWREQR